MSCKQPVMLGQDIMLGGASHTPILLTVQEQSVECKSNCWAFLCHASVMLKLQRGAREYNTTANHTCCVTWALDNTAWMCPAVRRFRPWLPVPPTLNSDLLSNHKQNAMLLTAM